MNGDDRAQVKDMLRRQLRRLVVMTLVLFLALAGVGLYAFVSTNHTRSDLVRATTQTTIALCTLRADLKQREQSARDFLAEHPHGIPGISAKTIRISITNEQRTVDALDILKCPPTPIN